MNVVANFVRAMACAVVLHIAGVAMPEVAFAEMPATSGPITLGSSQLDEVTAGGRSIISTASANAQGAGWLAGATTKTDTFAGSYRKGGIQGWAFAGALGVGSSGSAANADISLLSDTAFADGLGSASTDGGTSSVNAKGGIFTTPRKTVAVVIVISVAHGADAIATADAQTGGLVAGGVTRTRDRTITYGDTTIAISKSVTVIH